MNVEKIRDIAASYVDKEMKADILSFLLLNHTFTLTQVLHAYRSGERDFNFQVVREFAIVQHRIFKEYLNDVITPFVQNLIPDAKLVDDFGLYHNQIWSIFKNDTDELLGLVDPHSGIIFSCGGTSTYQLEPDMVRACQFFRLVGNSCRALWDLDPLNVDHNSTDQKLSVVYAYVELLKAYIELEPEHWWAILHLTQNGFSNIEPNQIGGVLRALVGNK